MTVDYLHLGPAPRPTTGEALLAALRARALKLGDEGRFANRLLDVAEVTLDGDDIAEFTVQATGVSVTEAELMADPKPTDPPLDVIPDVVSRTPGIVRHGSVSAQPLTIAGLPVYLSAEVSGVPIEWAEFSDGTTGLGVAEPSAGQIEGTGQLRVAQAGLAAFVETFAGAATAELGLSISDVQVRLAQAGERGVQLDASARVSKGFLGATVTAAGMGTIDDALVLTFTDVSVSSGNLLVSGLLATVRSKVDAAAARPISLADHLPAGITVTRADIRVDDHVTIDIALG